MHYFDNAATTPLNSEVKKYITELLDDFGNPSSNYSIGLKNKNLIEEARTIVKYFINAKYEEEIIFTSSGSASNSLAIAGWDGCYNIHLYSPTAHKSIIKANEYMGGIKLKVDHEGFLDLNYLDDILNACKKKDYRCLVSFEYANSEIGTINRVKEIIELAHRYNGIVLLDCTASIPFIPVDVQELNADMISFSGHKLGALKGVGVLYKNINVKLKPLVHGSQEQGLFGGTENVIGIASLKKAIELYNYRNITNSLSAYLYFSLTKVLILLDVECMLLGASFDNRLPNNLYLLLKGINGKQLVSMLDRLNDVQISTGSACNNYVSQPSHTLIAIGLNDEYLDDCIRITLSGKESIDELNYLVDSIEECVQIMKENP